MTDEKPRVRFDMKYIGWNLGATRVERNESKADIEILSMTIDDVDILQQLEKLEAIKTMVEGYHEDEQLIHPIKLLKILGVEENEA